MRNTSVYKFLLLLTVCLVMVSCQKQVELTSEKAAKAENYNDAYGEQLGTVSFPLSCSEAANSLLERGVALLHHMTYEGARAAFTAATEADPDCAMGYWGQSITYIHPLWSDPPSKANFQKGQQLANKAKARGKKSERELAYINALDAYYAQGHDRDESNNLASFSKGWEKVYKSFPKDMEAAAFYALAYLSTADPSDKTYAKQKKASEIARKVLAEIPDHPGAHHYTIHAHDYPALADDALNVSRSYGEIAPEVPHALHMPTHIFTRVGLWQDSIELNKRSAEAALNHQAGDKISLHYLHALDYEAYAYLQRAEDEKAKKVMDTLKSLDGPYQAHVASTYTFAAVPVRYALERHEWQEAANLESRTPASYPWDGFPAMEAITHFAKALLTHWDKQFSSNMK